MVVLRTINHKMKKEHRIPLFWIVNIYQQFLYIFTFFYIYIYSSNWDTYSENRSILEVGLHVEYPVYSSWRKERIKRHPFQCQLWVKCYRVKTFRMCLWDRRGRDRIVIGFITTYAISAYHHWSCEFEFSATF